jgi:hypothetical protein
MIHTKSLHISIQNSKLLQQKLALVALTQNFTSENTEHDSHNFFWILTTKFTNFYNKK